MGRIDATTTPRAMIGALVEELRDLEGNRDGIWRNESKAPGTTGGFLETNPLALKLRTAASLGWSVQDEITALEHFRANAESRWGQAVMDRNVESALNGGALFAAHKAIVLTKLDRHPGDVTEHLLPARGTVDGKAVPESRIFIQRFRPLGRPTGDVVVLSPGFLETGRVFVEQIDRLNRAGVDVFVMDHQWAGYTTGKKGGIADGESIALHTAAVTAHASEVAQREYGAKARVAIIGESMGAGPGAFGAVLLNDSDRLQLDGMRMPKNIDMVLQAPYFGPTPGIVNSALGAAAALPLLNNLALPGIGVPDFVDEPRAEHKVAEGMVLEDIRGRLSAFRAADDFIVKLKRLVAQGLRPGGNVFIVHDDRDPLADPKPSLELAETLGDQAKLVRLDGGNHGLASSDPKVAVDLLIAHFRSKRSA